MCDLPLIASQHKSTCCRLSSLNVLSNRKGVEVTGIVAVFCARHSCYCVNSVVDMTVGEKYAVAALPCFALHIPKVRSP